MAILFIVSISGCQKTIPDEPSKTKENEITYNTFSEWGGGEYRIVDGELYCKKGNSLGLLGEDIFAYYEDWTKTSVGADNIVHIEAYSGALLYVTSDGKAFGLGNAEGGKFGIKPDEADKTRIKEPMLLFEDCKLASLGNSFILLLKNDNTLWLLGESLNGQSTQIEEMYLEPIKIADNIQYAKAIGFTSSWIDNDNNLYMCGDNSYGQIGNGVMGCGFPTMRKDIVTEPYCALKDCIAFSVENEFNGVITVQAETINGEIYVWGGSHGAKPVLKEA